MPAQKYRLKTKKDFDEIFKRGKNLKEGLLVLKTAENNFSNPRFGFIISQKISKKATIRNKLRRRLRNIITKKIQETGAEETGRDFLFIVLPGLEKKEFKDLKELIDRLFKKI
jgi:ribonuclease P protein component